MSSIADALKKAQQERDRLRAHDRNSPRPPAADASPDLSIASMVLRKVAAEASSRDAGTTATVEQPGTVTPLADAIRQSPIAEAPAIRSRREATETIVEDYTSKHKLHLPPSVAVYHERAGTVAEQYRKIRDALMLGNPKRETQMLVITSAAPGEGRTTTVLNLGLSLAEIRANRVLLIDGCLEDQHRHRPSLTSLLKMDSERGLAEMLACPGADPVTYAHATPWHHLHILPSGAQTSPQAAMDLLKSATLPAYLRQFKAHFDWILIDAPAALTLPDAGLLGASCDGLVLAVAMHHTPREKVQTTVRRLKSMNLPIKACILTRA